MTEEYYVVFENINGCGEKNKRTFVCFKNKEEFKDWYSPIIQSLKKVVEEGVSLERALELNDEISENSRFGEVLLKQNSQE